MNFTRRSTVAVDIGSSALKMLWRDGGVVRRARYPFAGVVGSRETGGSGASLYETSGVVYALGSASVGVDVDQRCIGSHEISRVLVHHGLRAANQQRREIRLLSLVPACNYFDPRTGVNDVLVEEAKQSLTRPVRFLGEVDSDIVVADVDVRPSTAMAFVDYLLDFNGSIVNPFDGPIAVIDIGGRTTDCLVVRPDSSGPDFIHDGEPPVSLGVTSLLDLISDAIADEFSVDVEEIRGLHSVLETGTLLVGGRQLDAGVYVMNAADRLSRSIVAHTERRLGKLSEHYKILVVGGGAEILTPMLNSYAHMVIPREAAYASVRGAWKCEAWPS